MFIKNNVITVSMHGPLDVVYIIVMWLKYD